MPVVDQLDFLCTSTFAAGSLSTLAANSAIPCLSGLQLYICNIVSGPEIKFNTDRNAFLKICHGYEVGPVALSVLH